MAKKEKIEKAALKEVLQLITERVNTFSINKCRLTKTYQTKFHLRVVCEELQSKIKCKIYIPLKYVEQITKA